MLATHAIDPRHAAGLRRARSAASSLATVLAFSSTACSTAPPSPLPPAPHVPDAPNGRLFVGDSPYGKVVVHQTGSRRCLSFSDDTGEQTCIDMDRPGRVVHEYVAFLSVGLAFLPRSPNIAMIGLGGGAAARMFLGHDPAARMDVVELNPLVVKVAQEYFNVAPSERLRLHTADGRAFMQQSTASWDMIVLDAFGDDFIPFPLATAEFLSLLTLRLPADGVVVSNLWYRNDRLFRAMLATYRSVFPSVFVFRGVQSGNAIVVATSASPAPTCENVLARTRTDAPRYQFPFDFVAPARQCEPAAVYDNTDVPVLHDDRRAEFDALGRL